MNVRKFYAVAATLEADKGGFPLTPEMLEAFDNHISAIYYCWDYEQPVGYITYAEVLDGRLHIEGDLFTEYAIPAEMQDLYIAISYRKQGDKILPAYYGLTPMPSDTGLEPVRFIT